MELKIDELAELCGVTRRTIRYYVASGLLPSPNPKGWYDVERFERLEAIKRLRAQRLSLKEIREQLPPFPASPSGEGDASSRFSQDGDGMVPATMVVNNEDIALPSQQEAPHAAAVTIPSSSSSREPRSTVVERQAQAACWHSNLGRVVSLAVLPLAAAALLISVFAFRRDGASQPARQAQPAAQYAMLDAWAAFTGYANSLGQLTANLLGPSPAWPVMSSQLQEFFSRVDQVLTLREKACAQQ